MNAFKTKRLFVSCSMAVAVIFLLAPLSPVWALPEIHAEWEAFYGSIVSDTDANVHNTGTGCQLCHQGMFGGQPWNDYGWAIREKIQEIQNGPNPPATDQEVWRAAFLAVEGLDSDADPTGTDNITEITSSTQPGWTDGANNTAYFADGTTQAGQVAPAGILGTLDPVPNLPPTVNSGGPYSGVVGQAVQFDASGTTDPEGDSLIYLWDFGDGSPPPFPSQQATATHTYDTAGQYTAQLAVTDGTNDPVLVDVTVDIADAPPPPVGDNWAVQIPFLFSQFNVELEDFGGILIVRTTAADGSTSIAMGLEFDGVIFWMDISGSIYFGNIDRTAGTMSGIVFGGVAGSGLWFAERF